MIQFHIPGPPVPKGRPRIGKGRTYTPAKTKAAEAEAGWRCKTAMRGRPPLAGPVAMEVHFTMADRRQVDLDNLVKTIADACNGIAYADDHQITELRATKSFDGEPGATVTIRPAYG